MRRLAFLLLVFSAVAVPAAALAATTTTGDGTLVVKSGDAPFTIKANGSIDGTPVVRLTIIGSVIGQISDQGRIIIDQSAKSGQPEVSCACTGKTVPQSDTATRWDSTADGLTFRAVGGTYTIVIYGGRVSLVAVGQGTVTLAGTPNTPKGDGRYSLNGDDYKSLPGTPTKQLTIGLNG